MTTTHPQCRWCLRHRKPSEWEQQLITTNEWARLCTVCANERLNNPWNAVLPMRRIEAGPLPVAMRRLSRSVSGTDRAEQ